jgi:predicted RNA binding protein YcfA (HicA-like mRNA interferase family)
MSLPRDLTGDELVRLLSPLGYRVVRQSGSHMRLTTQEEGQHHVTIPKHKPLRIGTVAGILGDVAQHFGWTRQHLEEKLFKPR